MPRPSSVRGRKGQAAYHAGEHARSAPDAAHATHELQELLRQLHHQGGLPLAQGQEVGAQHPAEGAAGLYTLRPRPGPPPGSEPPWDKAELCCPQSRAESRVRASCVDQDFRTGQDRRV